jgi:geranylgeranyl diphosphate synthase type II
MNYSLKAGGKRLRPLLTIESAKIVGGNSEDAIDFAVAIEMIHTYSLIHDDLPALDNDDLRRGRATNHKVFGEAMAILAGDALLNFAYEVMLKGSIGKSNPEKYLKAIYEIAYHAGIYGMVGGQVVDVQSENIRIDKDHLDFKHNCKTAAMIIGCMRAGAIIGGADDKQLESITEYAKNIGLAFQIVDDILDLVGDEEKLGKKVGSDIENNKSTYPSLLGLDESRRIANELIDEAKEIIKTTFEEPEFLIGLADYIISRDR